MFRPTSPQTSLFEVQFQISSEKRERLVNSWAEPFRTRVLPLIDEEVFRDAFSQATGRPNTSIRLLVALHILRDWHDLTDSEVVEQLEYNLQWQYALAVEPASAHVSEKTLWTFRQLLKSSDRGRKMFEGVTRGLVEQDGLKLGRQRVDSTHVVPNIAILTRLGLFVETVTSFLLAVRREMPKVFEGLSVGYTKRYLEREGSFSDAKRSQAQRRLLAVAQDVFRLVRRFEGDAAVSALPAFKTLQRLFTEQCIVVKNDSGPDGAAGGEDPAADEQPVGDERVTLREASEIGGESLQTPHDTDATYGHKGKGYEVQVAESFDEANPYQVITTTYVNGANESDHAAIKPLLERLEGAKMKPETVLADTAYGSGANIVHCALKDVELIAPVHTGKVSSETVIDLSDFAFDTTCHQVLFCPGGHAPNRQEMKEGRCVATFAEAGCVPCAFAPECPTRELASGERRLRQTPAAIATELRQAEQTQAAFKDPYRMRSGIESTNNELKHTHGLGRLRVRGKVQVTLAALLKALALNIKRAVRHHVEKLEPPMGKPCPAA